MSDLTPTERQEAEQEAREIQRAREEGEAGRSHTSTWASVWFTLLVAVLLGGLSVVVNFLSEMGR